jgi:hypothetical protein
MKKQSVGDITNEIEVVTKYSLAKRIHLSRIIFSGFLPNFKSDFTKSFDILKEDKI